jgi:hypothetical protein
MCFLLALEITDKKLWLCACGGLKEGLNVVLEVCRKLHLAKGFLGNSASMSALWRGHGQADTWNAVMGGHVHGRHATNESRQEHNILCKNASFIGQGPKVGIGRKVA